MGTINIRMVLSDKHAASLQEVMENVAKDGAWPSWKEMAKAVLKSVEKARKSKKDEHKTGDMWRHEDEKTGEAIYKPMFVKRVEVIREQEDGTTVVKLHMSDGCAWTLPELEESRWKRKRK